MKQASVVGALLLLTGCYLHHGRPGDPDADVDASIDSGVDAPIDAPIDSGVDAPIDSGVDAPMCEVVTLTPEPVEAPVDIVWAIDSSRSMQDERARLQATINDFARDVRARVSDLHVVMITAENIVPPPLGTDADSFLFVPLYVDSNDALTALLDSAPQYEAFLRPNALLHFVVVSDDDSTLSAEVFDANVSALLGRPYTLHAIASPDVAGAPCRSEVPSDLCLQTMIQAVCGAAAIAVEYYRAASATSGPTIDVCLDDWSRVLGPLSDAVVGATPIPCRNELALTVDDRPLSAQLLVSRLAPQPLFEVAGAGACADGALAFYRESLNTAEAASFVLCPWACSEVERSGGNVELRIDCDAAPLID